jgi:aspartate racemase
VLGKRPLSLIELTAASLVRSNVQSVGLLASPTTIQSRLYEDVLETNGIKTKILNKAAQTQIERMIRMVIAGKSTSPQMLLRHIQALISAKGVQKVILGCTELSVVADGQKLEQIVDPLALVIEAIFGEVA